MSEKFVGPFERIVLDGVGHFPTREAPDLIGKKTCGTLYGLDVNSLLADLPSISKTSRNYGHETSEKKASKFAEEETMPFKSEAQVTSPTVARRRNRPGATSRFACPSWHRPRLQVGSF
jgi:hypothetical protein